MNFSTIEVTAKDFFRELWINDEHDELDFETVFANYSDEWFKDFVAFYNVMNEMR